MAYVACGAVTYASRRASSICGRLASVPSTLLESGLAYRPALTEEWIYHGKEERVEEEEDE